MGIFDKLNEQKQGYEEAFSWLKGRKRNQNSLVTQAKDGGYYINGNYVSTLNSDGSIYLWSDSEWRSPRLAWMLNAKFKAELINVVEGKVQFAGIWEEGDFQGEQIYGINSKIVGGTFSGEKFLTINSGFKTQPFNFIRGTYRDHEKGILGTLNYTYEMKNTDKPLELIRVPIGWFVEVMDDSGYKLVFQVLKKIDNISTDFIINIKYPIELKIKMSWEEIRSKYNENAIFTVGDPFGLAEHWPSIEFGRLQKVKSVNILREIPIIINFNRDKNLADFFMLKGVSIPFEINPTGDDAKKFTQKFLIDLGSGKFYSILKEIALKIRLGKIKGYGQFIHLEPVFNKIEGEQIKDKTTIEEMQYLDNFVRYIADNALRHQDNGHVVITDQLIKSLQKRIEISNLKGNQTNDNNIEGEKSDFEKKREEMIQKVKNSL